MTEGTAHPSFLELDRHCVGLDIDGAALAHLGECACCRGYVESYRPAGDVPAWLTDVAVRSAVRPPRKVPKTRHVHWWASGALAVAAAVLLALWWPPAERADSDGIKGAPSIGLHVQRDGVASLWDGEPLSPGDRIRLEVMPEEFDHISVFSVADGQAVPRRLYAGRISPRMSTVLPKAWELDDAPGAEQLLVILARSEVSPEAAATLVRAHEPREYWWVRLRLPKRSARP